MNLTKRRQFFTDFLERESLLPDLTRAIRATIAFMVPLLATAAGWIHLDPIHACIGAQTIAMVDVRGAYSLRFALLLALSVILSVSVFLGSLASGGLIVALVATGIVIAVGSGWRHLSPDYGPGLAVASGLLFFISMADPNVSAGLHFTPSMATLVGCLFGVLLQVSLWPFHPQHPLRKTVAESWSALGDLLAAMAENFTESTDKVTQAEVELRATLNRTQASLHAAKRQSGELLRQVELLNIAAARLGRRVIALRTALEVDASKCGFKQFEPLFLPVLNSMTNAARSVAVAVVSGQPSQWAAFEVRLKRLENLFAVARSQVTCQLADPIASAQLVSLLLQIEEQLPIIRDSLKSTLERANERAAFSMELFDFGTLTLQPLGAALNLKRRIDPALLRHSARLVTLCVISVIFIKWIGLPHGYWLPFTILVVLQPDFGATREKAAQRVLGTLVGGLIASSLLWLHPPHAVLITAIGVTIGLFGYFLKRNYGLAVVFITLMVVLITEWHHPVTLEFTLERMGITLGGGLLAMGAAWIFWPAWEKRRFPAIMVKALARNLEYLKLINLHLVNGEPSNDPLIEHLQAAESANTDVFSSLRRMLGDPKNQQRGLQESAALANGNKRVTQALSIIALHLNQQQTRHPAALESFEKICSAGFSSLIEFEESEVAADTIRPVLAELETFRLPEIDPDHQDQNRFREPWIYPQLLRICTELSAMIRIAGKISQ